MSLSDLQIRKLKPPLKGQKTYYDDTLPGFGVRISQGGTKTFLVVHGRQRQRTTIGRYPILSLSEDRAEAKRILAERTLGKHQIKTVTVQEAVKEFLADKAKRLRAQTLYDYKGKLQRRLVAPFRHDAVASLTKHQLKDKLDKLSRLPAEQNYTFVVWRAFFRCRDVACAARPLDPRDLFSRAPLPETAITEMSG